MPSPRSSSSPITGKPRLNDRSPITGVDRSDWEAAADALLGALRTYESHNGSEYRLPGLPSRNGKQADALEGYARPFLLAAYRIRGASGILVDILLNRYGRGLCVGVRRDDWGGYKHSNQWICEAASIAIALYETRPWLWDKLDSADRQAIASWLVRVNNRSVPFNNWLLFQVIVNEFLRSVDVQHSSEIIEENLVKIESMYAGDGWYSDGYGRRYDHYCGWAMAFYTGMWSLMRGPDDGGSQAKRYVERLGCFVDQYQYLFGADGGPIHMGRSLTYRWATIAPLWLAMRMGTSSVQPGTVRRIASASLRYFLDRGAIDPQTGLLTIGWHGPSPLIAQSYTGPSSPYWAAKGFLGLTLGFEHPVWSEVERPAPIDEADFVRAFPAPGWLVQGTQDDGVIRIYNHGSDHFPWFAGTRTDPHYRKVGYSTVTGPEQTDATDADSQVVFHMANGTPGLRQRFYRTTSGKSTTSSRFYPFELLDGRRYAPRFLSNRTRRPTAALPDIQIPSIQLYRKPLRVSFGHPRQVSYDAQVDLLSVAKMGVEARIIRCLTPHPGLMEVGGFALTDGDHPRSTYDNVHASTWRMDGMRSTVFAVTQAASCTVSQRSGTNAFGLHSAIPILTFEVPYGESFHIALIALGKRASVHEQSPITALEVRDGTITLTWQDQEIQQYSFRKDAWASGA